MRCLLTDTDRQHGSPLRRLRSPLGVAGRAVTDSQWLPVRFDGGGGVGSVLSRSGVRFGMHAFPGCAGVPAVSVAAGPLIETNSGYAGSAVVVGPCPRFLDTGVDYAASRSVAALRDS